MATLETLLSQQMVERLGWTLIYFVWQAAAVALLLAVALRCLRRSSPNVRYVVSCLAMLLIVALPLVTMSLVEVSRPVAEAGPILNPPPVMRTTPVEVVELPLEPFDAAVPEMPERVTHMPWTQRIATALEPALPWLVLGWLLGVFGLSAWHLGGWAQLQRMKRRLVSEVAAPLHARAAELAGRLGIRRAIGLWASPLIDVPAVVGWVKPVILLPVGAVSGLSVEQLEALLAHELAHVRRCDYLVNLAQTVVEILGFYHPAVWWVSHRIRDERENCCDDLAVQVCGDSRRYARALTSLEELRHVARASRPRVRDEEARARCPRHTAVAASGGSLINRIARLLGRPPIDNRRFAWLPGLIALLVVAALLIPAALLIAAPTVPQPLNTEADSAEAARDDNVTPTRLVHRNVEGRADRKFGFEQLIREEGEHWIVAIPYSTQSVGKMRCHVHADRGEFRLDGALNQPTPDGGTFRGNVVIEIASSDPNSIDACTLYLDEVTFSAQNKRFTSPGPVRLVCGATELAGRGLELSFDEPQDGSDPSRLTIVDGVGVQIAPSGSLLVSLGEAKTESSEASASRQPVSVRARTETADSRTSLRDGEPRAMLNVEPSADATDRQVLLSFTIAEIVTEEALDRATARQLRALLTDASHDAKFNLPSVEELQKPVQYIVSKYANICNQIDDAARAFTDLLVSRGYATVYSSPEMLIRFGESGHLSCDNIPVMGPPAPSSQTDNPALSLDVTPTAPHDANGIRLTLALRARNLASLDSKGRFSATVDYASFDFALSARNNQCIMLPLTTAVGLRGDDGDAKTVTTLLLVKPTLIEPPANPTPALPASEQATPDAAREFVQTDPMVRELAKKIAEVEIELLEAQQTFLPEHPEIVQKKQLLEALHRRLNARRRELHQELDDDLATRLPSVRVSAKTPDERASSLDEKPRVMLDIEIVKFLTDRPLSPEAAAQLSSLWDQMYAKREAGREQRGSLPRVDELQISPRALLERCTANAQGDSETLEILVDLLASREYLKVAMDPRVEVFDGQQAQVMSKQHVPNPTAQPGAPETVECRDLVTVTPRIDSAGHINLDLAAEICDVILNDGKTPRTSKHSIDTKAVVDKDKTFVCRLESAAEGEMQDNAVLYLLARPRIVPSAPSASVVIPTAKSRPSGPPTVTATFEGTDRREALGAVAEMTGVNIMCDPTVSGEVFGCVTLDDVSIEVALLAILAGSPYVATTTPNGYAISMPNAQPPAAPSREVDAIEVEARFVLVDRECMEALRRGSPIKGVTTPADVNALHEIGSGLAEGRTPLLKPDRVELLLRAVGQYAGSKMLAAPKVTVLDGESASVSLANHIQYISGYREPNDPSQDPIPQHASKEIGMRLDATPHLIEDQNNIRLQFEMEINSLLGMQKALYRGKYEYDVPTFTAVTTATEIVVADGQTALIHIGETPSVGNILRNESEPAGPLLMLIKPSRTTAEPPDPAPPMQRERRPGDPGMGGGMMGGGMGGLPPGGPPFHPPLSS